MELLGRTLPELVRLQVELEYDLSPAGLLVPRAGSKERNRCSLYVHACGAEFFFRVDVPERDRPRLAGEVTGGSRSETCVASGPFAAAAFADAVPERGGSVVLAPGGGVASRAWSVREDGRAAEVAVETAERCRRRGLAAQATAAWATRVLADGKVPFYSHIAGNDASRALAARLELVHVFTVFALE